MLKDQFEGSIGIEESVMEKYLMTNDGSNSKNIAARKAKGQGILDQIIGKLSGVMYGPFNFEVGLVLRQSMLRNGILTNAESWYGLKETDMEQLEQVDEQFLIIFLEVGKDLSEGNALLGDWGDANQVSHL